MQLQTLVEVPAFPQKITYRTPLLLAGSCFAAHIGQALRTRGFPAITNPFGVVYNPQSVAQTLQRLRSGRSFTVADTVCCRGMWCSFSHHSSFAHPDRDTFLTAANAALQQGHAALQRAQYIIVSLGTSWVYRHRERGEVVSNCHKFPAADFDRLLLPAEASADLLAREIAELPQTTWIFTVSPIRHLKDGAHHNQLSKAHLLLAIAQLQQRFPNNVWYFPAYEIMMDELRDYRFYADDMLHPSALAIDCIWQRFAAAALDDESQQIAREAAALAAARQHRPLHPDSEACRQFTDTLAQKTAAFRERYPFVEL